MLFCWIDGTLYRTKCWISNTRAVGFGCVNILSYTRRHDYSSRIVCWTVDSKAQARAYSVDMWMDMWMDILRDAL